eukprot:TRINITY_DN13421_c0_g1_i1.p1 TRINITY_DN13421_c0_g1~~TRINITY_DN13421_c0_g1_i1.p1  ORF type:complete len:316 (-),score=36.50 TRINITY_DN13421_c0_g1_i1:230-1177(-)
MNYVEYSFNVRTKFPMRVLSFNNVPYNLCDKLGPVSAIVKICEDNTITVLCDEDSYESINKLLTKQSESLGSKVVKDEIYKYSLIIRINNTIFNLELDYNIRINDLYVGYIEVPNSSTSITFLVSTDIEKLELPVKNTSENGRKEYVINNKEDLQNAFIDMFGKPLPPIDRQVHTINWSWIDDPRYLREYDGGWSFRVSIEESDRIWNILVDIYHSSGLVEISRMKRESHKQILDKNYNDCCITLYCGTLDEKVELLDIGFKIARIIKDENVLERILYYQNIDDIDDRTDKHIYLIDIDDGRLVEESPLETEDLW